MSKLDKLPTLAVTVFAGAMAVWFVKATNSAVKWVRSILYR